MWSYSTIQRSRLAARRPLGTTRLLSSQGGGGDGRRGNNNNNDHRRGGKRGGGWNRNNNNRRNNNKGGNNNNKSNYSDRFFKPAARGELKNHRSGIPKLTGRKGKGRGIKGGDQFYANEADELMGYNMDDMDETYGRGNQQQQNQQQPKKKTGTIDQGSKFEDLCPEDYHEIAEFANLYQSLQHPSESDEKYYWDEADYDITDNTKRQELFESLKAEATTDADGTLMAEVDDETFALFDDVSNNKNSNDQQQQRQPQAFNAPPEFLLDVLGVKGFEQPPNPKQYDQVQPLNLKGPSMHDFVQAMAEHPVKYGQLRFVSPHPESTREPIPDSPGNRRNPPLEFLEAHKRFVYVWGLPPLLSVDEKPSDLENPLHSLELQKTTAALFDVSPEAVYPASISSAFVGFDSIQDQRFATLVGPLQTFVDSPVQISKYTPSEGDKKSFEKSDLDRVVVLDNLPSGLTPSFLAKHLFPEGTDAGDLMNLTADDIVMLSPHKAVVRLESVEHATNAIQSTIVEQRLKDFGKHTIRYSNARRELVYTGLNTGPGGRDLERKVSPKLIVDGDMPTKNFYRSHATVLHLRNLDPDTTKQQISDFFQPHCAFPRDIAGSIEFVTCYKGLPTGKAFVGFDEHGEADAALEVLSASNGMIKGLGHNKVIAKVVRDARSVQRDHRTTRSEDQLLDSLDNWEQYADPEDLQELYANGISKEALDEQLRAIRYHNPTFSGMDQAMSSEAMDAQLGSGGMYQELVQTYISTLRECLSTPENPGPIYESLFLPDEELDTEIFEDEIARQEELKKQREVP